MISTPTATLPSSLQYALLGAAAKRAGRHRRRVVFIVHAPETFSALQPVVDELQRRDTVFDLTFIAVPRCYSGQGTGPYTGMESTYRFLHTKGLQPIAMRGQSLQDLEALIRLGPDFIFRQSPWDRDIPGIFNTQLLSFAQLCYVPYGLGTAEMPEHQYNQPFHNACDFIFCESEFHRERYADHRAMGTQGLVVTGYPRFEQLAAEMDVAEARWPVAVPADMPRVIWAPHHSVSAGWLGFSTFLQHKDRMLQEAHRNRISLLLRPHPAMRDQLAFAGAMAPHDYDAYIAAFAAASTSAVDTEPSYAASFAASDCLITDGLGFFADYLLTGKPLIRTRRADSKGLNAFAQWLVQACDNVDDGAQLDAVLEALAARRYVDNMADLRGERQARLLALADGAARRVVDALQAA